jgi:chemotaxis protein histidine kinase CheA
MLEELVQRFREKARERLEEMAALTDVISRHAPFPGSLERLARHFHTLAGLGATYGYPEVSRLGDEGEALLSPIVRDGRGVEAGELAKVRELVDGLTRALA